MLKFLPHSLTFDGSVRPAVLSTAYPATTSYQGPSSADAAQRTPGEVVHAPRGCTGVCTAGGSSHAGSIPGTPRRRPTGALSRLVRGHRPARDPGGDDQLGGVCLVTHWIDRGSQVCRRRGAHRRRRRGSATAGAGSRMAGGGSHASATTRPRLSREDNSADIVLIGRCDGRRRRSARRRRTALASAPARRRFGHFRLLREP